MRNYGSTLGSRVRSSKDNRVERHQTNNVHVIKGLFISVFAVLFFWIAFGGQTSTHFKNRVGTLAFDTETYTVYVTNLYGSIDGSASLYPWSAIAEPHKTTTLSLETTATTATIDDSMYDWIITHSSLDNPVAYEFLDENRTKITAIFIHAGTTYDVDVTRNGEIVHQTKVQCKYVRREIRSMVDDERERFLAATEVVHRLSMEEGQAKYGSKFVNYEYFTVKHLASMSIDGCSPYHNHDVFLTAHEAFVLEFDQALQSIDPSVTVPYWDYTIDSETYGVDWWGKSPIFQHDWFGPLNTSHDTGNVLEGAYFAGVPNAYGFQFPERNSYGVVTDKMNNNPSMYVTRSNEICGLTTRAKLPDCANLKGVLQSEDLTSFRLTIEGQFHATIHMAIGGTTDCKFSLRTAVKKWPHLTGFFEGFALLLNTLYRTFMQEHVITDPKFSKEDYTGKVNHKMPSHATVTQRNQSISPLMVCPDYCSLDTPFSECACSCPSLDNKLASGELHKYLAYKHLDRSGVFGMLNSEVSTNKHLAQDANGTYRFVNMTEDENSELLVFLLMAICHPGKMGQYGTPLAATNDPLFWPTHSSWGRLWAYVRLSPDFNTFNNSWQNESPNCQGMYELHDTLPFKNFLPGEDGDKFYSNKELIDLFDPKNPKLPYMYSGFQWSHCANISDALHPLFTVGP